MAKRSFGSISRLPSKRYRARYTGPDTKWHNAPTTFDTRIDSEAWLADERRLIASGAWRPPTDRAAARARAEEARRLSTFGVYADAWFKGRHDLRPATRTSYRTSIELHLKPTFGDLPLSEITAAQVRSWFASYGDRTPTARAHAYQVLSAILAQAEDDDLVQRNPCRIRSGGKVSVQREPEVLGLAELFALADAMPEQHRALTLICGFGGLRFGEVAGLRLRDVDLTHGVLRVRQGAFRTKGDKQVGPPKTPAGVRDVAIPQIAVEALKAHLQRWPVEGRNGLLFPGRDGKPLAASTLYGRTARVERRGGTSFRKSAYGFFAAREAIGRPDLLWHDLRRTAATLGGRSGATVREMQSRLGHTTPDMALRYQVATAERDQAIAARLQDAVNALNPARTSTEASAL